MAFSRKCLLHIVKQQHLRYSTEKSAADFWEIIPKQWRQPRMPSAKPGALAPNFAPSTGFVRMMNKIDPFKLADFRAPKRNFELEHESLQDHMDEESKTLGLTRALAQFLTFHSGRVRFANHPEWICKDYNYEKLNELASEGKFLDGIDLSLLNIDYVTVRAIKRIHTVTFFSAAGCPYFDDYCMDHLSANLIGLEELDLSDCPMITPRGLGILPRFKRLRLLKLDGVTCDPELELLCILLEEHFPKLKIEGITYEANKVDIH